ncbi:unnamed protein product [Paramecium sonneborni]|uniref:Uncharacterized protein n=1 Tax=Paramecium sonneborni TaxID=65129 RepID=A0A8S1QUP1_9CILI|nr:unnamed protein product [Paramecium sonneborni]
MNKNKRNEQFIRENNIAQYAERILEETTFQKGLKLHIMVKQIYGDQNKKLKFKNIHKKNKLVINQQLVVFSNIQIQIIKYSLLEQNEVTNQGVLKQIV